ncbi:MAG: c-type cytochrome domain-containing protein [Pirellulaceae bacterium]
MRFSSPILPLILVCSCLSWALTPIRAAVTAEQRAKIDQLVDMTREAGEFYTKGKFADSASRVSEIQAELIKLLAVKDAQLHRLARPIHTRLKRAHGLLELEGAELEPLPSWKDLIDGKMVTPASGDGVSFKDTVAPWLIASCGNCHINNRRGQFSMASFNDLMKGPPEGTVIFPGTDSGNRIVEVIESGDMPRGNVKVTPEQLASLKEWIVQGAKFDGPDPAAALVSYAKSAGPTAPPPPAMTVQQATGDETVSFAKDIAPILKENCNGCHIAGRQASGNFRMDSFAQLLRGGDSGTVIANKNAEDSLLIKKLKGQSGQRMPAGGRPALSDEKIELISNWIREGAKFDGPAATSNIDVVINQAWANAATHEELFQRRKDRALADWKRVLPADEPASASNSEVLVLGNVPPDRVETLLKKIDDAVSITKKQLDTPPNAPLIKGGLSVFVLKSRYDYSEFGRMTENRELPKEWLGHWRADPLDVYAVVANELGTKDELAESLALQVVAGAYLGSLNEVPTWFAEGVARNLVITNFRREDPRVKQWQASIPIAGQQIDNAKTLIESRLDEEAAGVVGMAITNFMMGRGNRQRFDKLLELLREGKSFNDALTYTYAKPELFIKSWLGK